MHKNYTQPKRNWVLVLIWVGLLLGGTVARAQSGPVGNEWIVPGQQYYRVKILKDGLYRLNYQYLTQAGIGGVAPSQLQVWRRGREIATYLGGNPNALDPTTFLEFYARHNDGVLDAELYKQAADQPNQLFGFYTDTASYFITWSAAGSRPGKHMALAAGTGDAPHTQRILNQLNYNARGYSDQAVYQNYVTWQPWIEPAEGYFYKLLSEGGTGPTAIGKAASNSAKDFVCDSVLWGVPPTATPKVEVLVFGASTSAHNTEILVVTPSGAVRSLGVIRYQAQSRGKQTFALLRSDISTAGKVTIRMQTEATSSPSDYCWLSYIRLIAPQANRWLASRHSVLFQNDSLQAGPATYDYANDSIPATVVGFDLQDFYNVQRVEPAVAGARRRFAFPSATASAVHTLLLADESQLAGPPVPARRVVFRAINPAVPTFTIITHPQLMAGPGNAVREYAAYRASAAGGRFDTLVVTTGQLFDQFNYGDKSWLAMRHFGRWLAAATPGPNSGRNLLLLGRGIVAYDPSLRNSAPSPGVPQINLVLATTRSVSDNMLTADFANNDFAARLNTGRLAVTTPAQVRAYLDKLQQYVATPDEPWRKNVLHLIGGDKPADFVDFRAYMDKYKRRVERPLFGGKVTTVERTVVNPVGNSLIVRTNIAPYLNPGLGLITYFGHGSNTAFALDIGYADDPTNPYNNAGKYPVMLFNNCAAGNSFTSVYTLLDSWLFTPNKGAVGAMGQYGFGYPDYLDQAQDTLYTLLFNNPQWYGKPVAAVYNEMVRRVQRSGGLLADKPPGLSGSIAAEQLLSTIWLGDPAVALYAPALPDFQVSNASLSVAPVTPGQAVTAASPTFVLNIGVTNPGKVTGDSIEIRVTRTVPGQPNTVFTRTFAQGPQGSATYAFVLANPAGANVFGNNTFAVEVDYRNRVAESNETNNTAQTTFAFLRGGITPLNPIEFAIVGNNAPRLVAQTNDPNGASRGFEFEVDTTAAFTSPLVLRQQVTAVLTPSWRPVLPAAGRDSVVWYWRVRFQSPAGDEDPNWVVSSFRVIQGRTAGGWSQSHYAQFRRDQRQGVDVSAPSGRWAFNTENKPLVLTTRGGGLPGAASTFGLNMGISANVLSPPTLANCAVNTPNLLIAVYDQRTLRPKTGLPAPGVCGQVPQQFYIFGANPANAADTLNTLNSSPARQAQLAAFLAAVPDGDYVAVVSVNRLRWPSLATVRTALGTLLGSQLVNQLQNGDPFALLAQKQASGGRVIHETGPGTGAPAGPGYSQSISLVDTLRMPTSRGTVTSTRIGPSQGWETLYHWIQRAPGATSTYTLKVIGIDTLNQATVLYSNVPSAAPQRGGFSLASVSAARYPYLQLELAMQDSLNRTPPQLKEWFITYRGVPEGVVRRDLVPASAYDPATLAAQAKSPGTLTFPVKFENVTPFDFGTPLRARVELRDAASPFAVRATKLVTAPRQLKGDSTITIPVSLTVAGPTLNLFGSFVTKVTVNPTPHPLPEVNLFNNELTLAPFSVIDSNVPPTLDVAFDGRHILNGELVSAQPTIVIQLNDEDRLRPITDRTAFTVTLRRPGQTGPPTLVDLAGTDVSFSVVSSHGSVATLEYRPGQNAPLPDGVYTLDVQGHDPSNAAAGTQTFQVKFEVVNASTITNVYPYPNPVINKARFVFTVTGHELPRDMKIQILTLTGRVVREILMGELGPLHIGNNITDFAWDGTDSFGDRLANGTYLYRVSLNDPSGEFSHRESAGDKAFKNDWGKLVLMR